MNSFIIMRLDAPLMSFGAPQVDAIGKTVRFVGRSMVAGMLANALGYDHSDAEKTQQLQCQLRIATRCDRPGSIVEDYQTVDLGQSFMVDKNTAWTSWGRMESRRGGTASSGTHIRHRFYHADSVHTLAVGLANADAASVSVSMLASALIEPARPLFLGRKSCLPAAPLYLRTAEALSPLDALMQTERVSAERFGDCHDGSVDPGLSAWWDREDEGPQPKQFRELAITDERDWRNQVHCGQRVIRHGVIYPGKEGIDA